jgi:sn-glycerol 3-phosphate transport system substrate-binding protein
MRRLFSLLVVLALAIMSFAVVSAQDEIVIDFYYPIAVDGPLTEVIQGYADDFMAANPGITVNPSYTGSYTQTRETILAEGMDPVVDVAVMLATDLYSFIEEGTIIPLDAYVSDEMLEDTFPVLLENSVDDMGSIWSIPFQRSTPVLYYNVEMLAEAGFDGPPTNNAEMLEMAQALTVDDQFGILIPVAGTFPIWITQSFVNAYGQPFVTAGEPATVNFNTPETLEAVTFLTELGSVHNVMPVGGSAWGDTPTAFIAGDTPMIIHTTGSLTSILTNADFEVGTAFLPTGPAGEDGTGYGSPTGGGNLYIFDNPNEMKSQEELDAAWAWVDYLNSPEVQSDWGVASGYIAARESAWEIEPLVSQVEEFPQYGVARDQLEIASIEFASWRTIDIQGIINSSLSQIISGAVPLEEAGTVLEDAQAQIDDLLAEYQ